MEWEWERDHGRRTGRGHVSRVNPLVRRLAMFGLTLTCSLLGGIYIYFCVRVTRRGDALAAGRNMARRMPASCSGLRRIQRACTQQSRGATAVSSRLVSFLFFLSLF